MSNTNQILAPPLMFHDNFKAFTGTLFWGLLPVEVEEHILYLLRLMYVGELNRMLLLNINTEEFVSWDAVLSINHKPTTMDLKRWRNILQSRHRAKTTGHYWETRRGDIYGRINKNTFITKIHARPEWNGNVVATLRNDSGTQLYKHSYEYSRVEGSRYKADNVLKYYNYQYQNLEAHSNSLYIIKYSHHTSLSQLKDHAKELGMKGYSKFKEVNKKDLVSKIYKFQ